MANRKSMSEAAKTFLQTGQLETSSQSNPEKESELVEIAKQIEPTSKPKQKTRHKSLRHELLGEDQHMEATIRFTVDLPRSLHRRLDQLSIDSGKPKTELARIMIRRILEEISY